VSEAIYDFHFSFVRYALAAARLHQQAGNFPGALRWLRCARLNLIHAEAALTDQPLNPVRIKPLRAKSLKPLRLRRAAPAKGRS